jgi:hypothetical protein
MLDYNDARPARYHPRLGLCYWNDEANDWVCDERGQPIKVVVEKKKSSGGTTA